jgi:site-specific recombinase XerD
MTGQPRKRRPFLRGVPPKDPEIAPIDDWPPANRGFLAGFREWLYASGYSIVTMKLYGVAARQALGYLNKPYWQIDPQDDLARVWEHLQARPIAASTLADYHKGLLKLTDYLRQGRRKPRPEKAIHWEYYIGGFPNWLADPLRGYIAHCQKSSPPERRHERSLSLLSHLTLSLRWMVAQGRMGSFQDLTPALWMDFQDHCLQAGNHPNTVNGQLSSLQGFLRYLQELDMPLCERMLLVEPLKHGRSLPRDVPPEQLRLVIREIQACISSAHRGIRRCGLMDMAWFLLMLHSGLRTGEVRCLRLEQVEWEARRVRIVQSKGLKDRMVYLSQSTIDALQAYLEVRGPQETLPDYLFIYRHEMLSRTYCFERMQLYSRRCGVYVRPHQLRHTCATLLLNSGAPVLTVKCLLGHKWVDTTLGYARLYDGTVAADYYGAMAVIERRLALPEDRLAPPPSAGQLLALLDSLRDGVLNTAQAEVVRQLRLGILAFSEQQNAIQDVKVQPSGY